MDPTQIRAKIHTYVDTLSSESLERVLTFLVALSGKDHEAAVADAGPLAAEQTASYETETLSLRKLRYPPVNQQLLETIVQHMLKVGSPLKIVLFGSYARGDAHADSDIDLLVIEDCDVPRYKRSPKYYLALKDILPPQDIVVWTPNEAYEWREVPNAFITTALREGKVLYEAT